MKERSIQVIDLRECTLKRKKKERKRKLKYAAVGGFLLISGFTLGSFNSSKVETKTVVRTVKAIEKGSKTPIVSKQRGNFKRLNIPLSENLQKHIFEISEDNSVPYSLSLAMIEHESKFNADAISYTSDYGLMQINRLNIGEMAKKYNSHDMLNAYQNVYCGISIIGKYLKKYKGDEEKALLSYNMGDYGATKLRESGIKSTSYSKKILELQKKYEDMLKQGKEK